MHGFEVRDNGDLPAFPTFEDAGNGLSKRELVAAMALGGLLPTGLLSAKDAVREALVIADTLLELTEQEAAQAAQGAAIIAACSEVRRAQR